MQLDTSDIHLWFADTRDFPLQQLEERCLQWLSEQERIKFAKYKVVSSRHEFLLGQFLLRTTLSDYGKNLPREWLFVLGEYGKPELSAELAVEMPCFNLTHSKGKVVLALSLQQQIGIDLEAAREQRRIRKIAQRHFSQAETEQLFALPEQSHLTRFYELWTLKESYIKATGKGLSESLCSFGFDISIDSMRFWLQNDDADEAHHWQFWQLDAGSDFCLALACRTAPHGKVRHLRTFSRQHFDHFVESKVRVLRSC